jgi:sugar lactone lactonase YvrE
VSFLGTSGLAQDSKGLLWTGEGTSLYGIDVTGTKPVIARRLGAPNGINPSFGIKCDGAKLYIGAWDGKVYALNLSDTDPKPALFCALPDKWRSAALAPPSLAKGFAAANRLFALAGNAVVGYGADGTSSGTVLTLPPPAQGAPFYNAVGIEPTTGDLLIAGYYPDINVYRYAPDGTQVKEGGWPRGLFAMSLPNIGGIPWALMAGGGAKALPTPLDPATAASVDNDYTYYGSGLVQDAAGTYWYGTSQGLLHFDRKGKSLHQRIGGVHDIRDLALTSDGTVVAFAEGGSRAIRLALDDDTDAPFSSNANEPWRVGGNWTGRAAAAIPDGSAFLVLDDAGKQLWRFDPTQSAKGQSNWAKIGTPAGLGAPKCYAAADTVAWIVDGGRLLEGARGDMSGAHAVPLPGIPDASSLAAIAALDDRTLAVADSKSVRIYMRDPSGSYAAVPWASSPSFVKIVGVAVSGAGLVVSDQDGGSVSLLDPKTGGVLAKVDGSAVDGGLRPGAVAALGNWAVVADEKNSRILRLRIAR